MTADKARPARNVFYAEGATRPGTEAGLSERFRSGLMSQVPSYARLTTLPQESGQRALAETPLALVARRRR
jgi:hypothetical protein